MKIEKNMRYYIYSYLHLKKEITNEEYYII